MKKRVFIAFAVLALFFVSYGELAANLRFGVVTDKSFSFTPFLWTAGLDFDFLMARHIWLSPEVYMTVHNFDFGTIWVAPAVLLNYSGGGDHTGYYLGGGITKWWRLGPDVAGSPSSDFALKLNAAIISYWAGVTLTVFMITPFNNIFQDMTLGVVFSF